MFSHGGTNGMRRVWIEVEQHWEGYGVKTRGGEGGLGENLCARG